MPQNPLDLLKRGWQTATTPLVNADSAADAIDSPSLERSPGMARLQGFGAGALQGLAGLTSPLELAGMATLPGAFRAAKAARAAKNAFGTVTRPSSAPFDLVDNAPTPQVNPSMGDADSLIGDLQRNLAKVPSKRPAPMDTLGESAAEFTPIGGEGLYNAGQGAQSQLPADILDMLMPKMGGRGR